MSLELIDRLIAADADGPRKVCVLGDAVEDEWLEGELTSCQDGCPCFRERSRVVTPGGAAGAARQLTHWQSEAWLVAPAGPHRGWQWKEARLGELNVELCFESESLPLKQRRVAGGRVVGRTDREGPRREEVVREERELALKALRTMTWGGVLLSDYDKGFLSAGLLREAIDYCRAYGVPCVADGKKWPGAYRGAVLKVNREYADRHSLPAPPHVVTGGPAGPLVSDTGGSSCLPGGPRVECVNHVGAGDCFAAHLALALAHGLTLEEAATVAHAAGRVYVQRRHGRPPHPLEVRRDLDPVGGKIVPAAWAGPVGLSAAGRVVFTNGVFRTGAHAGHAELLAWCKAQGDTLVVGLNDDTSAFRVKKGGYCLPLPERAAMLAALGCVDWVVPFEEDTPAELCRALAPTHFTLCKGPEEAGTTPPGAEFAGDVRFYPGGHFAGRHATTLVREIRGE
jgi:D-beta-D-heptose 7-phosphate kinase/D-beta-D-heptose 1-phosphate adenosyltransferase